MRQVFNEKIEEFLKEFYPKISKMFNVNIGDKHKIEDIIGTAIIEYQKKSKK
ncbi:MAG TPA: hypothetical protein HA367_03830 [Candidatus Methanofastidiosum sp.]|nr:hypothetical protein [Methanofastidiosum sp.]